MCERPKHKAEVNTSGRRLRRVVASLEEIRDKLSGTSDVVKEKHIIQQYAEDLVSHKENLKEIECCLLKLELDDNHDLIKLLLATRKMIAPVLLRSC